MQKLISLWKNESGKGNVYYTGKIGDVSLIAFENNNKTNEKQPDLIIYIKEETKQKVESKPTTIKANEVDDPFKDFGEQLEINDQFLD